MKLQLALDDISLTDALILAEKFGTMSIFLRLDRPLLLLKECMLYGNSGVISLKKKF